MAKKIQDGNQIVTNVDSNDNLTFSIKDSFIDSTPTVNSTNLVTSGGVKSALDINTTDIAAAVVRIANNETNISNNTSAIQALNGNVSINTTNISTNTTDIDNLETTVGTLSTNVNANTTKIGTLNNLTTTDKTSLVSAINEINVPSKLVSVGATAPENGERIWFGKSRNLLNYNTFIKGRINGTTGQIEHADKVTNFSTTKNTISFTAAQAWNNGVTSDFIPFKTGTYVVKGVVTGVRSSIYVDYYDAKRNRIGRYSNTNMPFDPGVTASYVLNLSNSNASYIRVHFEASVAGDVTITDLQLEKGATATPYEPYVEKGIYVDGEEWYYDNYSTDEQVIGKWIDGKPLYRKVISFTPAGNIPANT
jgi:hypothetical protein